MRTRCRPRLNSARRITRCGVPILAMLLGISIESSAQACEAPRVETGSGEVCGKQVSTQDPKSVVHAYLGIPFAAAPVNEKRFHPPIPRKPWTKVLQATSFGPACPQELPPGVSVPLSEDCLSLNVWTPDTAERLPVMVFLHGGSFIRGGSAVPTYEGTALAAGGPVVVVTLNYRLGALGFLGGLEQGDGNYGILDQQLALRWVQENIAAFGGDPGKVTLFGQESGAMSVGIHLAAPSSQTLFRAAIEESNPYALPYKTALQARADALEFAQRLGCTNAKTARACLQGRSWQEILAAQAKSRFGESLLLGLSRLLAWSPIVDNPPLKGQPNELAIEKPAILGTVVNEGTFFLAEQEAHIGPLDEARYIRETDFAFAPRGQAIRTLYETFEKGDIRSKLSRIVTDDVFTCANRLMLTSAQAPVWGFRFSHVPSFPVQPAIPACAPEGAKICDGAELPFVFGNPISPQFGAKRASFTDAEKKLSQEMIRLWTGFSAQLSPPTTTPAWAPFTLDDPFWMLIHEPLTKTRDLTAGCRFWDVLGYDRTNALDGLYRARASAP